VLTKWCCINQLLFPLPLLSSTVDVSTWPHLRCDVGLEGGEYKYKLSLCYSIVYYYSGAQRYEQFLQVGRLYRALILLGLALCLLSASVSSVFVVLYINFCLLTSFSLPFSELSLVGLALDLVD